MTARGIADVFARVERRLIGSLKRNLHRHLQAEEDAGMDWPAWQADKLRQLEGYRRGNAAIMAEEIPAMDEEIEELIRSEYTAGVQQTEAELRVLGQPTQTGVLNVTRLDVIIDDTRDRLHTAETASLRMMDDVYRRTIHGAELAAATGALTPRQAIDMATKDFLDAGINCIQYSDGRRVNIASYAEMAVRSALLRSYLQGEAEKRSALGIDTVLVSQYGACSDTCLPWQGKVYIDDVWGGWDGERRGDMGRSRNGKWYMLLSVAVAAGLFHPNCRHSVAAWVEGVSKRPPLMDATKVREASRLEQGQRAIERRVVRYKRLAEGSGDPDNARKYQRRVRQAQAQLRQYIADHGDVLRRDNWREQTHGVTAGAKRGILYARYSEDPVPITDRGITDVRMVRPHGMTREAAKELQRSHRQLLRAAQELPVGTEVAGYCTPDGGLISLTSGEINAARIPPPPADGVILIHNHPHGEILSIEDITAAIEHDEIRAITAVGNNGVVHMIHKLDDYDAAAILRCYRDALARHPRYGDTPDSYIDMIEDLLKEARHYGIQYVTRR